MNAIVAQRRLNIHEYFIESSKETFIDLLAIVSSNI